MASVIVWIYFLNNLKPTSKLFEVYNQNAIQSDGSKLRGNKKRGLGKKLENLLMKTGWSEFYERINTWQENGDYFSMAGNIWNKPCSDWTGSADCGTFPTAMSFLGK